ncbi:MAG TPA: pyridoxamine 5'-phosphate oxidase family protein [Cytophagaceae bacterium]|jgi:hypothetical protein
MKNQLYHNGELKAQELAGETSFAIKASKVLVDHIIPGAVNFIQNLPYLVASSIDVNGNVWASLITGNDCMSAVIDEKTLILNRNFITSNPIDPLWTNLERSDTIGLLFIELSTRRRYRINGTAAFKEKLLSIRVDTAYPNCPKYIQARRYLKVSATKYLMEPTNGDILNQELIDLIKKSDTFFVGSSDDNSNLDVSHRGGVPGFINVINESTIEIPDYEGNSMYNTLGNFLVNPNAGLLFIDFEGHKTLQMTGLSEINWDIKAEGTVRAWKFSIKNWLLIENAKDFEWQFMNFSPFNPQ